ncbi:hypothetical protein N7455_006715 [Penicillium solitum]|uniref:uncharacterized protein n=1 Tax=Penicillium solitum TaxID=60172 RepID=UPI0032C45D04|nr:hypothetical protein N7455_006715 [Penicillium solitum]
MRAQSSEVTNNSRSRTKEWINLGFLVNPVQGSDSIRVGNHDGFGACPTYRVPGYSTATNDWINFSSFPSVGLWGKLEDMANSNSKDARVQTGNMLRASTDHSMKQTTQANELEIPVIGSRATYSATAASVRP